MTNTADENAQTSELLDDGQSGRPRLRREKSVKQIVNPLQAQSTYSKFQHRLRRLASFVEGNDEEEERGRKLKTTSGSSSKGERYRIRAIDHDRTWFDHTSEHLVIAWLTNYFKWTFRASFFKVILSACVLYILNIFVFAIVVYIAMSKKPQCIIGTEELFFIDAYHLSWTTFSTVGYGVIGPAVTSPRWYVDRFRVLSVFSL